jgi:hypothetical protein
MALAGPTPRALGAQRGLLADVDDGLEDTLFRPLIPDGAASRARLLLLQQQEGGPGLSSPGPPPLLLSPSSSSSPPAPFSAAAAAATRDPVYIARVLLAAYSRTRQYRAILERMDRFSSALIADAVAAGGTSVLRPSSSDAFHESLAARVSAWLQGAVEEAVLSHWPYRENAHVEHALNALRMHPSVVAASSSSTSASASSRAQTRRSASFLEIAAAEGAETPRVKQQREERHRQEAEGRTLSLLSQGPLGFLPPHMLLQRYGDLERLTAAVVGAAAKQVGVAVGTMLGESAGPRGGGAAAAAAAAVPPPPPPPRLTGIIIPRHNGENDADNDDDDRSSDGGGAGAIGAADAVGAAAEAEAEEDVGLAAEEEELLMALPAVPSEAVDLLRNHLEALLLAEVYEVAFGCSDGDVREDEATASALAALRRAHPDPSSLDVPRAASDEAVLALASAQMRRINATASPLGKMEAVADACDVLVAALKLVPRLAPFRRRWRERGRAAEAGAEEGGGGEGDGAGGAEATGADDLLPALMWLVLSLHRDDDEEDEEEGRGNGVAHPPPPPPLRLLANVLFIERYRDPAQMVGKAAYCFVHLRSCLAYLDELGKTAVE